MSESGETTPEPGAAAPDGYLFGGQYELGDLLGVGGTASVFEAEDVGAPPADSDAGSAQRAPAAHPRVAVKILHPHLSADAASRDAFLAEARATQELRHPNIAAVRGSGVHEAAGAALAWIALDLVDAGSVGERVDAAGPLPPAEAAAVLDGVLSALAVAHAVRLVHRDVSPANVMLHGVRPGETVRTEHVRLVDFGLADAAGRTAVGQNLLRAGGDVLRAGPGPDGAAVTVVLGPAGGTPARAGDASAARTVVGNPQFVSPEQAQGRPVRMAGDLYQAGALLYYLLTARPPYPRDTDAQVLDAHVSAPPPVPSALVPRARAFDRVVTRAMHKTPVRRFRDAAEMRAALAEAAGRLGPDAGEASAGAGAGVDVDVGVGDSAAQPTAGGVGQRGTGDLEYLRPVKPEPTPAPAGRNGATGVGIVVIGLLVAGLAAWVAVAAPGLPGAGTSPSPSTSATASPTPTASQTASPSPSTSASSEPTAAPSETAAPSRSPTTSPSATVAPPPSSKERVRVPVLTGTLAEAQAALRDAGLVLGEVTRAESPEPADTVLDQRPAGSRSAPEGASVDVTVASGSNAVPEVAGMTLGAAVAELESAGFEVVPEDPNAPPTVPASGTAPAAGTVLRLGVSVTVLVGEPDPTPSTSPS